MTNEQCKSQKVVNNDDRIVGLRRHSEEVNKLVVESLQGALLLLIGKKPYDNITITELCRKAGVSRMAFYGNFQSKDDIFNRIVTDLHTEMITRVGSPFRKPFSVMWYGEMFRFVAEKSDVLGPIFSAGYHDKYLQLVNSLVLRLPSLTDEEKYISLLWIGGIVNAVVHWLMSGMRETPEQMASYCNRCFANFVPRCQDTVNQKYFETNNIESTDF